MKAKTQYDLRREKVERILARRKGPDWKPKVIAQRFQMELQRPPPEPGIPYCEWCGQILHKMDSVNNGPVCISCLGGFDT